METFEKARSCRDKSEYISGIKLINHVFRDTINCAPTMQFEFPYLLSEDNMENMMIVKDGDKVVSIASFLKRDISIEGNPIKTASIGAVCTYEEYRGQQLSSKALDSVEEKMVKDGVMVSLVSGTRTLYTRRKYVEIASMIRYKFEPEDFDFIIKSGEEAGYDICEYSEEDEQDIIDISKIYNQKSTRFIRDLVEFKTIINTRPFTWGELDYRKIVIKKDGKILSYLILQTISGKNGVVVEAGGCNNAIEYGIAYLSKKLNLESTVYDMNEGELQSKLDREHSEDINNGGTVKIMNYVSLMNALKPYISQYYEDVDKIEFSESDSENNSSQKIYKIKIDEEELEIEGVDNITNLIFGKYPKVEEMTENMPNIQKLIAAILPIPIPYTENLNYQ